MDREADTNMPTHMQAHTHTRTHTHTLTLTTMHTDNACMQSHYVYMHLQNNNRSHMQPTRIHIPYTGLLFEPLYFANSRIHEIYL